MSCLRVLLSFFIDRIFWSKIGIESYISRIVLDCKNIFVILKIGKIGGVGVLILYKILKYEDMYLYHGYSHGYDECLQSETFRS